MGNIIVCADGTWNRPEKDLEKDHAANVLKVARAIAPSENKLKQQGTQLNPDIEPNSREQPSKEDNLKYPLMTVVWR